MYGQGLVALQHVLAYLMSAVTLGQDTLCLVVDVDALFD